MIEIEVAQGAFIFLLFMLCYLWIHRLIHGAVRTVGSKSRLTFFRHFAARRLNRYAPRHPAWIRHIADSLESLQLYGKTGAFLMYSSILTAGGVVAGALVFHTMKGAAIAGVMGGLLPYLIVRIRLINLRMKTRIEFLPAVEIFYQAYLLSGHCNIRAVLRDSVGGTGIGYPMKPVFEQLYRHLMVRPDIDDGLRIFTLALGNPWAEYFAGIVRFGLLEGVDIAENLKELIGDMRKAQRADQAARNRLLEIRIANFTPVVFLAAFLGVNFKMNYHNAVYYYLVEPNGRDMLLDSAILIFASFLMGIYLSMKRM